MYHLFNTVYDLFNIITWVQLEYSLVRTLHLVVTWCQTRNEFREDMDKLQHPGPLNLQGNHLRTGGNGNNASSCTLSLVASMRKMILSNQQLYSTWREKMH